MAHIIAIASIAIVARGIACLLTPGMVLGRIGEWYERQTIGTQFYLKPCGFCGKCSVWLWGTAALGALHMLPDPLWLLPIYWIAATGAQDLLDP